MLLLSGGTGITGRDVTPEAIDQIKDKYIPGFGEVFRYISIKKLAHHQSNQELLLVWLKELLYFLCLDLQVRKDVGGYNQKSIR